LPKTQKLKFLRPKSEAFSGTDNPDDFTTFLSGFSIYTIPNLCAMIIGIVYMVADNLVKYSRPTKSFGCSLLLR